MRSRRRQGSAGTEKGLGSQLLGLSLFVMLLAFFIVINSISSYQDGKIKPVLQSLEYAFASKVAAYDSDRPSTTESEEISLHEGDTLDRLKALFTAQIPSNRITVNKTKGTMHVRVKMEELESAVIAAGQRDISSVPQQERDFVQNFFLPTLISVVRLEKTAAPYRMDMMLNIDMTPAEMQNKEPQRMMSLIKSISGIAEKVETAGMPRKLVSIGLARGEKDTVDIYFRRHIPYSPVATTAMPSQP